MKKLARWFMLFAVLTVTFGACKSNQKTIKKGKPIPCPQKDC